MVLGVVLACALLAMCAAASSAYASGGFGIERYALTATEEGGAVDTQAGSHPHALTLETTLAPGMDSHEVKSLAFELPPGLIVDPHAVSQSGAVGEVEMMVAGKSMSATVYNVAPAPGELGRFSFGIEDVQMSIDLAIGSGGDGMTLSIEDIAHLGIESVKLILGGTGPSTLLTLPTSCASSPQTTLQGESWGKEGATLSAAFSQMTGCQRLAFDPSLSVASDVIEADTPSGYELDLNIPQPEAPEGLASADLEEAAVALPEGVGISLSAADGLQACTEAQAGLGSQAAVSCPDASKIGTVEIHTPLLANPLQGAVYLATPSENPYGSPLAVYISAVDPVPGVTMKLAGEIEANQLTGQLTIVLREMPQLPISALELHFFGGERALLSTPPMCGLATSTSALTPWSGAAAAAPSSGFEIDAGMDGTACSAVQPFDPTFQATSTTAGVADAYGSLSLLVSRTASEQQLGAIAIQAPPAVAQLFADMPACGEPQASEGACPAASEVGTATGQAGLGPYPADLNGEIYLTGAYGGAAQGLEIVLPVEPSPLELGDVVVRASTQIEPGTGRLSIAIGRLPSFADGASLQFKALLLQLDRGEAPDQPGRLRTTHGHRHDHRLAGRRCHNRNRTVWRVFLAVPATGVHSPGRHRGSGRRDRQRIARQPAHRNDSRRQGGGRAEMYRYWHVSRQADPDRQHGGHVREARQEQKRREEAHQDNDHRDCHVLDPTGQDRHHQAHARRRRARAARHGSRLSQRHSYDPRVLTEPGADKYRQCASGPAEDARQGEEMRRQIAVMLFVLVVVAAIVGLVSGCGTSAPVSKAQARTYARAINLHAADVPA